VIDEVAMRTCTMLVTLGALSTVLGCDVDRSSFAFALSGDIDEHVTTTGAVTGVVDNAGDLVIDDGSWQLAMSLQGLGPGGQTLAGSAGELADGTTDYFATTIGGSCSVFLAPHESTNGSAVSGTFYCTKLTSSAGKSVNVGGGEFTTFISDTANNPGITPAAAP
jgi:hypothetical protein